MDDDSKKDHTVAPTNIEDAVKEFQNARQQRIAKRRGRVGEKIAAMYT